MSTTEPVFTTMYVDFHCPLKYSLILQSVVVGAKCREDRPKEKTDNPTEDLQIGLAERDLEVRFYG